MKTIWVPLGVAPCEFVLAVDSLSLLRTLVWGNAALMIVGGGEIKLC